MEITAMKKIYSFKALLCFMTVLTVTNAKAIVIRHDTDDIKYQQLAKRYINAITYNDGCVGTVIDPLWVLTAAHCLSPQQQRPLFVVHLGKNYPVEFTSTHPEYDPQTNNYDMALLRVKWPIENAERALLYSRLDEIGKKVTFVGNGDFGNGLTGLISDKAILRAATNMVTDTSTSQISFVFDQPDNALALEGISGPHDSGGPAFIEEQSKLYIAGVSSWQNNKGKEGVYGVVEHYARVSTQRHWINHTIKKNEPSLPLNHPLLTALQAKSFANLKKIATNSDWIQSSALIRELLIELTFKLSAQEAKEVLKQIPELAKLQLNNISLTSYAIEQGNWALVDTLIEYTLNINEKNIYGESYLTQLLMLSPPEVDIEPLLSKLLEKGLDINLKDNRGNTALALAVYLGHRDNSCTRVKLLLKGGANPNIADINDYSPLMYIASVSNEELLSLLILHGANVKTKDNTGKTALDYAKNNQHIIRKLTKHFNKAIY